jgi:hypothetical protein
MQISLTTGRIFHRTNQSGVALLGVVEVPEELDTEGVHNCFIHGGVIIVDSLLASPLRDAVGDPVDREEIREESADSFFYRRYTSNQAGGQEFFFRQTVLPSSTPGMKWCYITGARPKALPQLHGDGMYALGPRLRKVEMPEDFGRGINMGGLLRETVWGPAGAYGLAHTLEVGAYPQWVAAYRARNAKRDPKFAAFMQAMAEHGEAPLFYTAAQREERDALCDKAIRGLLGEEESPRPRG